MSIFRDILSKILGLALVAAILIPVFASLNSKANASWGPITGRPTYTWASPADHVTFNSITDNPRFGDERPFFGSADVSGTTYSDNLTVTDNQEVSMRIYYHNNAASNLNLVARNTKVQIQLPHTASTATFAVATISADNSTPGQVWDTADLTGARPFTVEYEPGSAQIWNNVLRGTTISDSIVTSSGALIGYNAIDGNIPGCEQYSGYVTIKVRVHMQAAPTPAPVAQYACTLLNVNVLPNRRVDSAITYNAANGATFKTVSLNWGDGSTPLLTTNTNSSYMYSKDGTYTIMATLNFDVNGSNQTATCSKTVTITTPAATPVASPTPPAALPNTGPGSIAAVFAAVSTFAGLLHYKWNKRFEDQ